MAEVYQGGWQSAGPNPTFWTRLRVSYSGSTAQAWLQIMRDSGSASGYVSTGNINCGGTHFTTKSRVSIGPMTIDTTYRDYIYLGQFSINPAVATVVNAWANCESTDPNHARFRYNANSFFSGVTIPAQVTVPSGVSATLGGRTWNRAEVTAKVTSWGGNAQRLLVGVFDTSSTTWSGNRREEETTATTSTTSWTQIVSQASSRCGTDVSTQVCKTLKGCVAFKVGAIAINSAGSTSAINSTTYYLPPSPMTALSVTSQTGFSSSNSVTVNFSATGGNSTNNENVNVTTQYRYSTNNGSTWTSWANVGSAGTPWTARTGSFSVPYKTATLLQTRQVYQSQASETKQLSFTSTYGTAPTIGATTVKSKAWNSMTVTATVSSYGTPSSMEGRYVQAYISSPITKWSDAKNNVTSGDFSFTGLVGCTTYTVNGYGNNKISTTGGGAISVTTPPAPLTSASHTSTLANDGTYTSKISVVGSTSNNASSATVYYQYRYSTNDGPMSDWKLASSNRVTVAGTSWDITGLNPSTKVSVDVRMYQTDGNYSSTYSYSFETPSTPPELDISWNETRDTLYISASAVIASDFEIGYAYGDANYTTLETFTNTTTASSSLAYPDHGNGETLTIRARNKKTGTDVWSAYEYKSTQVPNPIIGVIRYPDGSQKYIVDIREKKADGTLTQAWKNGQRVLSE